MSENRNTYSIMTNVQEFIMRGMKPKGPKELRPPVPKINILKSCLGCYVHNAYSH